MILPQDKYFVFIKTNAVDDEHKTIPFIQCQLYLEKNCSHYYDFMVKKSASQAFLPLIRIISAKAKMSNSLYSHTISLSLFPFLSLCVSEILSFSLCYLLTHKKYSLANFQLETMCAHIRGL